MFIVRVFEGAITWSELRESPLDEISYLLQKAIEINDEKADQLDKAKSKRR